MYGMPASRCNYIVLFKEESQVYGTATEKVALETPPPEGVSLEDKRVFFITYEPDNEVLAVHKIDQDKVLNAEIKLPKKKKK